MLFSLLKTSSEVLRPSGALVFTGDTMYIILALLLIKHFLCDYPLQSPWMLRKSAEKGWLAPLSAHAYAHAFGTYIVFLIVGGFADPTFAVWMMGLDFLAHWLIDFWKARLTRPEFGSRAFWNYLGLDQLLHNLTYLAMIFLYSLYTAGI